MKKLQRQNTLTKSAAIVTLLAVFERALGFLYRIVLSRLIGAEGLGVYQVSLSLFSLLLVIGTGGIPITLSRFIAKNQAEKDELGKRQNIGAGVCLCLLITLPTVLIILPFADKLTFLFSDKRCIPVFRILLLGLVFCSLFAVIRGAFWGDKNFFLPALLELVEETVMVIVGVLLLRGQTDALSGAKLAACAVTISYLTSFTLSTLCFFIKGGRFCKPKKRLKTLFNATLPITCVRGASSLVNSAIAVLLPAMLIRAGLNTTESLKIFGVVSGMATPVLSVPTTVVGSLALVLVPELSGDYHSQNKTRLYKNIERGLRFPILFSCYLIPFFFALGDKIGLLAFSNTLAGEYIKTGCWILLPMSVTMISTSILNSIGFEKQTFLFYFVGAAVTLVCVLVLPPVFGGYAYILGLGLSFTATAVCNLLFLRKKCDGVFARSGKLLKRTVLLSLLLIIPCSLYGKWCAYLCAKVFSPTLSLLFTALTLGIFSLLAYLLCGLFRFPTIKGKKRKKAKIL